ncbi:unnamed protein product, partial [Prunus brigantina]
MPISMWDCGHQLWDCHVALGLRSPPSSLARVLGMGLVITFGRLDAVLPFGSGADGGAQLRGSQKVTLEKTKGRVESMGEEMPGRFDFRASRAVSDFWRELSVSEAISNMSDSESIPEREPNAFDGESSDRLFDSDNQAVGPDAEDGSDTDVEILGEGPHSVPLHGIGKGLMTAPVPLSIVYSDGRRVGLAAPGESSAGCQSEPSTSSRGESSGEPSSRSRVSVVFPGNVRVPMGVPKAHLFGVDYLEPNRITEREIAKYRAEYFIPDSVGIRIPTPTESLSRPKEGEVVFFTDVLQQGVRLPLQPDVQRIFA